jgi:hypothetical protein
LPVHDRFHVALTETAVSPENGVTDKPFIQFVFPANQPPMAFLKQFQGCRIARISALLQGFNIGGHMADNCLIVRF